MSLSLTVLHNDPAGATGVNFTREIMSLSLKMLHNDPAGAPGFMCNRHKQASCTLYSVLYQELKV